MAGDAALRAEFDLLEAFWRQHAGRAAFGHASSNQNVSGSDTPLASLADDAPNHDPLAACPELRCITDRLARDVLAAAAARARSIGVSADRTLIASGTIAEDDYVRALADLLDIPFDTLAWTPRDQCPLDDTRLIEAVPAGIVPVRIGGELVYVVAPRGTAARRLTELMAQDPRWRRRIRLTTTEHLKHFVGRHCGHAIGDRATNLLHAAMPQMSAAPSRWQKSRWKAALIAAITLAVVAVEPRASMRVVETLLAAMFIAWIVLRLVGAFMRIPGKRRKAPIPDGALPVYTIMVALYREASSVDGLVAAIRNLDYPPEKLDVKFVIEPDDDETHAALVRARLTAPFEIVVAPAIGPRTKPKALNAALPFARGSFLVIYDAEDRPEPDQLRQALDIFRHNDDRLACVQACLTIDNTGDNWLSAGIMAQTPQAV